MPLRDLSVLVVEEMQKRRVEARNALGNRTDDVTIARRWYDVAATEWARVLEAGPNTRVVEGAIRYSRKLCDFTSQLATLTMNATTSEEYGLSADQHREYYPDLSVLKDGDDEIDAWLKLRQGAIPQLTVRQIVVAGEAMLKQMNRTADGLGAQGSALLGRVVKHKRYHAYAWNGFLICTLESLERMDQRYRALNKESLAGIKDCLVTS